MADAIIRIENLTKIFPGVRALNDVSLSIERGATHALLGENGAGKSTLIKILCGVYRATTGTLFINGHEENFQNPSSAFASGIRVIHQETSLIPKATALQNVFLGHEMTYRKGFTLLDERAMVKRFKELCNRIGVTIDPHVQVRDLSVAYQKVVEILKALAFDAQIIIMDEPTDSLFNEEVERLFRIIGDLKRSGITIIYITHYLDEVFKIADWATVLRDGEHVATRPIADLNKEEIVSLMVGKKLSVPTVPVRTFDDQGVPAIEIRNLSIPNVLTDISFSAHYGEVVGITGVIGAGKSELGRAIFGADVLRSGTILREGKEVSISSPQQAKSHGIGMIPENRKAEGLILKHSVKKNMSICSLDKLSRRGVLLTKREDELCSSFVKELNIKISSLQNVGFHLSGGNQQKVVIAKWLMNNPRVLIMDEPTHGIDIGAKQEIFALIRKLAAQGRCILYLSSEISEISQVCHRILVIHKGRLVREVVEERDQHTLLKTMIEGA
ncbi:MAG: sugar ABC transporter ATP-binding protein [Sphaerochaeta sp.]|nr:sugar ABC transporter ATP-binding protein [Sphaerochaeta sp.]